MEPNRLEQDFRNKLEQRTIEPSPMAWDRLDAMLSVTEEKKKPKRRTWMYVAASFLGFMLVGVILLQQEKESTGNTIDAIVNAGQPEESKEAVKENPATEAVDKLIITPGQPEAVAVQADKMPGNKYGQVSQKQLHYNNASGKKNSSIKAEQVHKAEEALAAQQMHNNIANETDQLLAASLDNTDEKRSSVKVNAKSLLSSVEEELNDSFRQDVLQKIVKNYNTVKTSVANRNYQ